MKKHQVLRVAAVVAMVGATTVLTACSVNRDLVLLNSCGAPVVVGVSVDDFDDWFELDAGSQVKTSADGVDSVGFTVLPAGAEQVIAPVEVRLNDLDFDDSEPGPRKAEVSLAALELCP